MGTATVANGVSTGDVPQQPQYLVRFELTMSSSYATGGDDLDVSSLLPDGATISHIWFEPDGVYHFKYDRANAKVLAYEGAAGINAEVSAATDLDAVTVNGLILAY